VDELKAVALFGFALAVVVAAYVAYLIGVGG